LIAGQGQIATQKKTEELEKECYGGGVVVQECPVSLIELKKVSITVQTWYSCV
jgi:Na+-translocating ferredoxin:NAD+ oxidoreductase RNF subunit RnfB